MVRVPELGSAMLPFRDIGSYNQSNPWPAGHGAWYFQESVVSPLLMAPPNQRAGEVRPSLSPVKNTASRKRRSHPSEDATADPELDNKADVPPTTKRKMGSSLASLTFQKRRRLVIKMGGASS